MNDNRYMEYGCLDPDRHYVRDYLKKTMAHFKECKILRDTINDGLMDEMFGLQTCDPAQDPIDENAIWANLQLLWPLEKRVAELLTANRAALARLDQQRAAQQQNASKSDLS